MRGHAETPDHVVDHMVNALFSELPPKRTDSLLDPGCGEGAFIAGVLRWCRRNGVEPPRITGIEQDPQRLRVARSRFGDVDAIELIEADYLADRPLGRYRFIVGNPPYVGLPSLPNSERDDYRSRFACARGRFDLYFLFFERAVEELEADGRLVFVTPEKWLYVESAAPVRNLLASNCVERIELLPEDTFPGKVAYPCVMAMRSSEPQGSLTTVLRNGWCRVLPTPKLGEMPWWGLLQGGDPTVADPLSPTLARVTERISAGVATGADAVFLESIESLPAELLPYARLTLSGRDFAVAAATGALPQPQQVLLFPYDSEGKLLPEDALGPLGQYLGRSHVAKRLRARTCAAHKPWYAYHDSVPKAILGRPKILCKDISSTPRFWVDSKGEILPRHSVYYVVPKDGRMLYPLAEWLNGDFVQRWLSQHSQRAAKGYLRLQASVIKRIPLVDAPAEVRRSALEEAA